MSVRPAKLDLERERGEQSRAPPASSTPPHLARNEVNAPGQSRKRTTHKPRRAVVRRRGARVDSESEQDDLDPQRANNVKSRRDSDSESDDLDLPSSDDEDSEEEDDDDGVAEPKTPATASVEQLPQSLETATTPPRQPPKSRKAVLTGQVLHPSWSDMPAPGEDGDTSLPTLDFSNLSLDVVQHLPSPPPRTRPAMASTSKAAVLPSAPVPQPQASTAAAVQPGGLTKKQLQEQKRQVKLAALKQTDPEAAERIEKERQERLVAKRLAKKERLKEKKRERKALEHAARDASSHPAASQVEQDAVPAAPPSASNDKPARPAKSARPVVPSRPSRTAVALGLLGPESPPPPPASSEQSAPPLPPSASATTPIVPTATRQPAFLPRDSEGRPVVQSLPPTRPRAHHQTDDDHAASQWVRGRGGAPRGFGSYRGGRGAARFAHHQDRDEVSPPHPDAAEEDRGSSGRGRGRGAIARGGGFAGRGGRGVVATGPPGSINPRYAHLPFHPLHRFPSPSPVPPKSASPAPSNRSTDQASNVGPEVTTASPDERLFETGAESSASAAAAQEQPTGVVKLPATGAAQIMMTVKGAAAAQAAREHGASKENRAPAESADAAATSEAEPHKLSDPGILYASAPRRPTEQEAADASVATSSEAPREPLSLLHQVPPHLQASAGPPVVEQDGPVYYQQQQQPYSGPYWSSEAPEPYPISTPSPAPAPTDQQFGVPLAHPAPSSAYFVPPRPNKRVEIKNPSSRDGQSPAPSTATKSAPPAPVDALEAAREIRDAQILQQQEHQRQAEASYMHAMNYGFQQQQQQAPAPSGWPPFPSSPTFTRDVFPIPTNAPLPPPSVDQQAVLQPLHAPQMYNPYPPAHVMAQQPPQPQPPTTTTYELVAPYPSHYPAAAAYYAPQQQPMYQPSLSPPVGPPVGPPAGYYGGMYGARPVVYEEQQQAQWTGY